ncbi:MAG TPA: hypothetical protein VFN55_09425 [Solirubrobacteraceae bacterium]|nr:hypothetical protein [Solirubrobacteraceae bacterium]
MLFAAVNVARKLKVDPELALRAASERFRSRVQAASDLATSQGATWDDLAAEDQLIYYARARLNQGDQTPS